MNLEQIVKETVAKIVAEKKGKDLTGDGKIDSADYLQARSNAIEKAMKNEGEDHEVSMAQRSLDSIIRAAMELKAKIGDQEIDIPAWIQDHITNSENYIDQASQGYHEYENGGEEMNEEKSDRSKEADKKLDAILKKTLSNIYKNTPKDKIPEKYRAIIDDLDEARFKKGTDIGGKGFEFKDIAKKAAKQYGSEEAGKRVAGAVMKNILNKEGEGFDFVRSAIESASGDKISHTEEDDYGRTIYWSTKNPNVNYFVGQGGEFEGKIYLYNGETGERYPIGDLKHYGDGQNHTADDDMHESQQKLDEWTIRRMQHYAGIK